MSSSPLRITPNLDTLHSKLLTWTYCKTTSLKTKVIYKPINQLLNYLNLRINLRWISFHKIKLEIYLTHSNNAITHKNLVHYLPCSYHNHIYPISSQQILNLQHIAKHRALLFLFNSYLLNNLQLHRVNRK